MNDDLASSRPRFPPHLCPVYPHNMDIYHVTSISAWLGSERKWPIVWRVWSRFRTSSEWRRVDKSTNAGKNASRGGLFVIESSDRRPTGCPHLQRLRHCLGYHSKRGFHSCERQGVVVSIVCMTRLRVGPGCCRQMRIGHDGRSVRRKLRFHTRIYRRQAQSSGTKPGCRILAFGYAH